MPIFALDSPAPRPRLSFCWFGLGTHGCVLAPTALVARCTNPRALRVPRGIHFNLNEIWDIDPGDLLVVDTAITRPLAGQLIVAGPDGALTVQAYHPRKQRGTVVRGLLIGVVCGQTGQVWEQPATKEAA